MGTPGSLYLYSQYLRHKYGTRVYRVSVDAGFSCPNRGADRDAPGCIYCDELGSRAPYLGTDASMETQVKGAVSFLRQRYAAQEFTLYFQAFTNTNAPPVRLKAVYDYGLSLGNFRELIVSTRPDCLSDEKAQLLASYKDRGLDVWVELGLQSFSDKTLERLNRGHCLEDFISTYRLLKDYQIKIAVHLIFGLPGEDRQDILQTVQFLAALYPDGLKIHNLHIPFGTQILEEFRMGEITVPANRRHLEYTIEALELIPEQTVIMRLTCDTPVSRLALPRRFWDKAYFLRLLREEMVLRQTWQGRLFRGSRSP